VGGCGEARLRVVLDSCTREGGRPSTVALRRKELCELGGRRPDSCSVAGSAFCRSCGKTAQAAPRGVGVSGRGQRGMAGGGPPHAAYAPRPISAWGGQAGCGKHGACSSYSAGAEGQSACAHGT